VFEPFVHFFHGLQAVLVPELAFFFGVILAFLMLILFLFALVSLFHSAYVAILRK